MSMPELLADRLSLPVICSPMFIISNPDLVIEQCKAGLVGSFPALNARPAEVLDEWLIRIKTELADYQAANPGKKVAPFAVNQIIHGSNDRLEHDLGLCIKHEVPIIITSLMAPNQIVGPVHDYGGLVFHDVINIRHARKAAEAGVDGLILVCSGAGGHAGSLSPFALVQEVREFFDGTILLAGSISTGRSVLAAQAMGADLAYMGTRFIATKEANADPDYKQMLIDHAASDIVYSSLFTGVHGNYLKPSISRAGLDPENLPEADKSKMNFGSAETKAWRDIWGAGQGLGSIKDAPATADLVAHLVQEYTDAKADLLTVSNYP
ncbi:NAD(P)H-dependent flavin oxidoreductase [Emcibacter nanhaiensis]|uniref:Nitronate monooxygenase n=1 Tax=Emcibacter nanhaiensis TaxID=1505037 RepID=A0A501PRC0_9PROT|nr:nitronate monooxygenase family protein [Emcibacter nanhaiensis]TPD62795.1 nitronate monooxygenase [Emcibacter nanhaiensis]